MTPRRNTDMQLLADAAKLFAKLSGACEPGVMAASLQSCGSSVEDQVVSLRRAYERYLDESSCSLRDLVAMAKRGDMILRFGIYVRLDALMTSGRLDRIYQRALRKLEQGNMQ